MGTYCDFDGCNDVAMVSMKVADHVEDKMGGDTQRQLCAFHAVTKTMHIYASLSELAERRRNQARWN